MKKILALFGVFLMTGFAACKGGSKGIEVKGSDTLLELVQSEGETYIKKTNIPVNVTGGGSGVGVAALINKTTDIANSSRPIKNDEIDKAKANGVNPLEIKLGVDAIAIVVNPSNPVKELTIQQLAGIFRGEIKNWKELGGSDTEISLYGRQENSGTYVFFQEHILNKKNYSDQMKRMNGNSQMIEGIKADKAGIGYVGLGYVFTDSGVNSNVKLVPVVGKNGKAILPTDKAAVFSGEYAISRYLLQYVDENNFKGNLKEFIKFILSDEGQDIVKKTGFYPLGAEKAKELNPKVF